MASSPEQQMTFLQHGHDQTPHQEQELSLEQSLQLVMIFLNASLACICYTRELLRWNSACFRIRYIEQVRLAGIEPDRIYTTFLTTHGHSVQNSQEIRVLVRGASSRADHVLNMLEEGVFDAIRRAYLDTLHVFVATDANGTREIHETYSFQFKYDEDRITTIRVGESRQAFTLQSSQRSFKAAIRVLLRSMQGMPHVPDGFTHASDHGIDCDHWKSLWRGTYGLTTTCFRAAHHHVETAARVMQSHSPSEVLGKDEIIKRQLQDMQTTSSSCNYALQTTQLAIASPRKKRKEDNSAGEVSQPLKRTRGSDLGIEAPRSRCGSETHEDGYHKEAATPRRKRSISKMFVTMDFTSDSEGSLEKERGTAAGMT
ncbi:hypothetical protein DV735_g2669, partial [Chaetothyriales sp. CBS 134920]